MNSYNIKAYKNAFANVDKINQVIMLFDTAIASMQQAKQAIIENKIEERFNKLSKVFSILTGLRDSLDYNAGGELAKTLSDWYSATSLRVLSINRTQDLSMCDLCEKHLKEMRLAWLDVENQIKENKLVGEDLEKPANANNDNSGVLTNKAGEELPIPETQNSTHEDFFSNISKVPYSNNSSNGLVISV